MIKVRLEALKAHRVIEYESVEEFIGYARFWWASGDSYDDLENKIDRTLDYFRDVNLYNVQCTFVWSGLNITLMPSLTD